MIDKEKLMIGSAVCYDPEYPELIHIIKGIYDEGVDTGYHKLLKYDDIFPIPLTVEILDRVLHLKPTEIKKTPVYFNGDNIFVRTADMAFILHDESNGKCFFVRHLSYLHELQNLYAAIEGHDIEIK